MNKLTQYAQHFAKLELMKASLDKLGTGSLEVFENESACLSGRQGREGVDFILKTNTGNYHELYLQPINLETERSVKISKSVLGEPKYNLYVALVLFMNDREPIFYLIPSIVWRSPNNLFTNSADYSRNKPSWGINIEKTTIPELAEYEFWEKMNKKE